MSVSRVFLALAKESNPSRRKCAHRGCITILAAGNPGPLCFVHQHGQRLQGRLQDLLEEADLLSTMQAARLDEIQGFRRVPDFHGRQDDDVGSLFHMVQGWQDQEGSHVA